MSDSQHDRITKIFIEACELPQEQREQFVRDNAGGDDEIVSRVMEMLAADAEETEGHLLSDEVIDVKELIESENVYLELLKEESEKENPDLVQISHLQSQIKLPEFLSSYVEAGQKSNAIFDILPEEEFAEASIGETKLDLK